MLFYEFIKRILLILLLVFGLSFLFGNLGMIKSQIFDSQISQKLDFNKTSTVSDTPAIIVSPDEKITTEVFEKNHEAVVNIVTTTLTMDFWRQVIPEQGQGTGFIIDSKGYILTNNHVVDRASKITVTLASGKKVDAFLIGRDPRSDLAVIRIPERYVTHIAELGNSNTIKVGQKAIAIGNPFGLSHTLTTGIVSAVNREIKNKNVTLYNLIQTDTAINPGNSGGPLLNSNGQVMGINTAIFSMSGGYQGIGFAIPVNRAKAVATEIIMNSNTKSTRRSIRMNAIGL